MSFTSCGGDDECNRETGSGPNTRLPVCSLFSGGTSLGVYTLADHDSKQNLERCGVRAGETGELGSWGARREFDGSELQVECRLFEARISSALDKAPFPGSKENKHIKKKKATKLRGHQSSQDTLRRQYLRICIL